MTRHWYKTVRHTDFICPTKSLKCIFTVRKGLFSIKNSPGWPRSYHLQEHLYRSAFFSSWQRKLCILTFWCFSPLILKHIYDDLSSIKWSKCLYSCLRRKRVRSTWRPLSAWLRWGQDGGAPITVEAAGTASWTPPAVSPDLSLCACRERRHNSREAKGCSLQQEQRLNRNYSSIQLCSMWPCEMSWSHWTRDGDTVHDRTHAEGQHARLGIVGGTWWKTPH